MKKSTLNTAALLAVVLFSALSCHNRTEKEEQTFPEYSTMRLDTATAVVYNEYSTIIQSNTSVEIRPRISGYLSKKYKKEGSLVKKGDTLYVIDDADYRQQVRAAKAAMEAAKSGVSNSSLEVKKLTPLVEKGIISPYELESAKIALESAKAQYDQAAANYENARITLSYTVIKSPINGVLGLNNFSVGSLLSPSSQEPLTVISGEGDAQAYFSFDEKRLAPIRREQLASGDYNPEKNQIELILADGTPYRYKGRLSSASGIIDKTTGSIQLKVIFPNPDYSILSGSSGVLRFPLTYHGVITIPQSATYELQDRKMVFVVNEDNSLSRKSISVEGISGNYYVVSNLSSGTVIVTEGVGKLKEGMIITPKSKAMFRKILDKPVLATVISIIIVVGGILGLVSLPITTYPVIAPPLVQVTANYSGANSEVVLKSVIAPLEEQINGVEGMTYIVSTAGNDGSATIQVYFELGYDADMAAVNVQNRVAAASSKLPSAVTSYGVTTEKMQNTILMMVSVYSENPDYDAVFVENYVRINVFPELQRVNGVGRVNVFGAGDYSIKVWMDPDKMTSLGLMPSDIAQAIQEQNIEAAPGKFGQGSGSSFEYTIKYKGKFVEPSEYEKIVIKAFPDGRILKLGDIAKIELTAFNTSVASTANGYPGVSMGIYQMAGSNAKEVIDNLVATLDRAEESFPEGMHWVSPYNTNVFLNASIHQVLKTLLEAFLLVFLVVLVFLQDFRSTIIPSISALVALIGSFFCLKMFGFSINMLTLFALVLAIGIVVDDAIVVVEAVHAKLDGGEKDTRKATSSAMGEISSAIISISLVMSAVFIPVSFMSGPSGVFYRQFALTLASAVILSAINALTLSPVLCTILIRHKERKEGKLSFGKKLSDSFNTAFDTITERYAGSLKLFARRQIIPVGILVLFAIVAAVLMKTTPTAFIPDEDQGILMVDISMPAGSSLGRSKQVLTEVDSISGTIPYIKERMCVAGSSLLNNSNGGSYSLMVMSLIDWEERKGVSVGEVISMLKSKTSHIKDGEILFFIPPTVPGFGISSGFEVQLQDKTGGSTEKFYEVQQDFIADLSSRPEIQYATSAFNINFPQYEFDINVDRCKLAGVSVSDLFNTMQSYYGGAIVSDFNRFTKYYRVMIQAAPEYRRDEHSIDAITVRNSYGDMVPVSTLVNFRRVYGSESLKRYNLFTASTITGASNQGYSTGDAIAAIRDVGAELPTGYGYDFSGMTREEINSSGQQGFIFLLCFLFVYLILAAQYNSYILPWSVMISLIIGIAGVFIAINLFGIQNNIYVQVAMIMLIGLLAKNGILIVEFAKQRHEHGLSIAEAAIEGAKARLRPILMTSFAFIFGMIPLCTESGAGAIGNRSIGIAAAGGMLIGTFIGVFIIPIMYIIFQKLAEKSK